MARHLRFGHGDKRRRPYWRDSRLLGKTWVDKQTEKILILGIDAWTRQQIVDDLHIGNFNAAQNLTRIANTLDVQSLDDFVARFTIQDLMQQRGVGETTVIVFMAAQEARQKDPIKWLDHKPSDLVTLATEKHRAMKRQFEERQAAREAKRRGTRLVRPATAASAVAS